MGVWTIDAATKLCKKYRLPVANGGLARTPKQAVALAKGLKYPLALKVASPQVLHKTEAGAVALHIRSEKDLLKSFDKVVQNAKRYNKKAKILGVFVQEMGRGAEFIIGGKKDPQFGHVLLFGVGGTLTEIYKDYALKLCPVSALDAAYMMREIRAQKVLDGFRNAPPVDREQLAALLVKTGEMLSKENIKELDLNPVLFDGKAFSVVDARIIK